MATITIRGKKYEVERKQIIESIKGKEPKPIKSHYVEIKGVKYPIKQPVGLVLKMPGVGFTSADAYRILEKLGFEVHSLEG
jgi:hypothetical protein